MTFSARRRAERSTRNNFSISVAISGPLQTHAHTHSKNTRTQIVWQTQMAGGCHFVGSVESRSLKQIKCEWKCILCMLMLSSSSFSLWSALFLQWQQPDRHTAHQHTQFHLHTQPNIHKDSEEDSEGHTWCLPARNWNKSDLLLPSLNCLTLKEAADTVSSKWFSPRRLKDSTISID